jgi:CheY-like chemotaxis protein
MLPNRAPDRVLVVEDDLDTAQSLALLLRDMGHTVEFAINARAGLEIAQRLRPTIVFIDLMLPDMDGCELARVLRADPTFGRPRVLAITGNGSEDARRRTSEAGCEQHLVKPVDGSAIQYALDPDRSRMTKK